MDQSKKTMRHFYCRDVLWETFEQMANDFDCSIDYLINEAMRYYARSKNYQSAMATSGPVPPQPQMGAASAGGGFGPNGPGGYGNAPTTQPAVTMTRATLPLPARYPPAIARVAATRIARPFVATRSVPGLGMLSIAKV